MCGRRARFGRTGKLTGLLSGLGSYSRVTHASHEGAYRNCDTFRSTRGSKIVLSSDGEVAFHSVLAPQGNGVTAPVLMCVGMTVFLLVILYKMGFLFPANVSVLG